MTQPLLKTRQNKQIPKGKGDGFHLPFHLISVSFDHLTFEGRGYGWFGLGWIFFLLHVIRFNFSSHERNFFQCWTSFPQVCPCKKFFPSKSVWRIFFSEITSTPSPSPSKVKWSSRSPYLRHVSDARDRTQWRTQTLKLSRASFTWSKWIEIGKAVLCIRRRCCCFGAGYSPLKNIVYFWTRYQRVCLV